MKNVRKNGNKAVVLIFALLISVLPAYAGGSKDDDSAPKLGQPDLLQEAMNKLPALPLMGNNLKFQFGGETWIATNNGRNFLAGSCISQTTDTGSYVILIHTHTYPPKDIPLISWVKTGGPSIVIEFKDGPPSSMKIVPKDELPAEIAALVGSSEKAAQGSDALSEISLVHGKRKAVIYENDGVQIIIEGDSATVAKNSTAEATKGIEVIDGTEREVLTLEANLGRGGESIDVRFLMADTEIVQKLKDGSGIRFKVLGDGETWRLLVPVSKVKDGYYHFINFSTDYRFSIDYRFVQYNFHLSEFKQEVAIWIKPVRFSKDDIIGLMFEKGGPGHSTIKIFDLEIY